MTENANTAAEQASMDELIKLIEQRTRATCAWRSTFPTPGRTA